LQAFRDAAFKDDKGEAWRSYDQVLEFLRLGRLEWLNEAKETRGAIFELSWKAGVQKIYIDALLGAAGKARAAMKEPFHFLEKAKAVAETVLEEAPSVQIADSDAEPNHDYRFGFQVYPSALAHRALGDYYFEVARRENRARNVAGGGEGAGLSDVAKRHLRTAAAHHGESAKLFCPDDEWHCESLFQQVLCLFLVKTSARIVLSVLDQIAAALGPIREFWGEKKLAGQDEWVGIVQWADWLRTEIKRGRLTLNSAVSPDGIEDELQAHHRYDTRDPDGLRRAET